MKEWVPQSSTIASVHGGTRAIHITSASKHHYKVPKPYKCLLKVRVKYTNPISTRIDFEIRSVLTIRLPLLPPL